MNVCDCCGAYIGDAPHSPTLGVDARSVVRVRVCVRCRDWLEASVVEAFTEARAELARLSNERAARP